MCDCDRSKKLLKEIDCSEWGGPYGPVSLYYCTSCGSFETYTSWCRTDIGDTRCGFPCGADPNIEPNGYGKPMADRVRKTRYQISQQMRRLLG